MTVITREGELKASLGLIQEALDLCNPDDAFAKLVRTLQYIRMTANTGLERAGLADLDDITPYQGD
jgi:hypothetical protein